MPSRARPATLIVLLLAGIASPRPMEVRPTEWPLDRFVANLEQRLAVAPDDGKAHYTIGRALAFGFALERDSFWEGRYRGTVGAELREQERLFASSGPPAPVPPARALERLAGGVLHLRRACELDAVPEELEQGQKLFHDWWTARKHLTLAWLLETGAHLADRVPTMELLGLRPAELGAEEFTAIERWIEDLGSRDPATALAAEQALATPPRLERALARLCAESSSPNARRQKAVAALLERFWIERAIAEYWLAYEQNVELELEIEEWELERLVSYEALLGYERLVRRRGPRDSVEEQRLLALQDTKARLEAHPRGELITPVLLSLDESRTLDELIAPGLTVPFDLDGNGIDELWPWIAPGTGWLVWDPARRGEITSGRQLFGSASAWLFFEDGYRVLDALDDDGNGELRGAELLGIAAWFDRDSDGVSDRGEVVPVVALGIVALATEATERIGRSLGNPCGLELADGRVLPTYDWVLSAADVP